MGFRIFLIDHAWTFRPPERRQQLEEMEGLLERMMSLLDLEDKHDTGENGIDTDLVGEEGRQKAKAEQEEDVMKNKSRKIDKVLLKMWNFAQTYSINAPGLSTEAKMPIWYVMDEFGSRIQHGDIANVRTVPFYYSGSSLSYTILFPTRDLAEEEEIVRDYVEVSRKAEWRHLYLHPWIPFSSPQDDTHNIIPDISFYVEGRSPEFLPDPVPQVVKAGDKVLKIFCTSDQIVKHVNHPRFVKTESMEEADVLWLVEHFKDYKTLAKDHPGCFVNQFPHENILTVKDLLAAAIQSFFRHKQKDVVKDPQPRWFPITFNLQTELPQFTNYFFKRQQMGMDNHWIVKPWNLARGLDTHVSNNLTHIIRLVDSGPKIVCKYLDDPVLYYREDIDGWVKFDLRYIVFLRGSQPPEIYLFDGFWIRFALQSFELKELDNYERHFTVFNYLDECSILQMRCEDFIGRFESQYPKFKWTEIQKKVNLMLREVFIAATAQEAPKGIPNNPQSKAMYGVDVMLKWAPNQSTTERCMEPVLLEFNFMPDCERACNYYPEFANTVFSTLFLDEVSPNLMVSKI